MAKPSLERILIVNDDGIDAPGIAILEHIAKELSDDVWVVAPATGQSAKGHALTLHKPLEVKQLSEKRFSVNGTPTDTVITAFGEIVKDNMPTLLLSGINRGGNLGYDMTYSGTVSAAMEGLIAGIPSIALSQLHKDEVNWKHSERHAKEVIKKLVENGWPSDVLMNVNFPDANVNEVTGIEVVKQSRCKIKSELIRHECQEKNVPDIEINLIREWDVSCEDTDIGAVFRGSIAITPVQLDMTDYGFLKDLQGSFNGGDFGLS